MLHVFFLFLIIILKMYDIYTKAVLLIYTFIIEKNVF